MEITAHARFIRMSPRKVRLIANLIRSANVSAAETKLQFVRKDAVRPILKLVRSAVANAAHNFNVLPERLFVKSITVNQGPTLKRFAPRAFGRAAPIRKRTSHISIILAERANPARPAAPARPV